MFKYFFLIVTIFSQSFSNSFLNDTTYNFPDSTLIISSINFSGNKITKSFIIEKEMLLKKDSFLTYSKIKYDIGRIYSLELFNSVKIKVERDSIFAKLEVEVTERLYFLPYPILSFKDHDIKRFFYGAGFLNNNLNGEHKKINANFATGYDPFLGFEYEDPYFDTEKNILIAASFYTNIYKNKSLIALEDGESNFKERWYSGSIKIGKRENLFTDYSVIIGYSSVNVADYKKGRTVSNNGKDNFPWIKLNYKYDSRDLKEYASSGIHYRIEIAKYGVPQTNNNYTRVTYDGKYFFPFNNKSSFGARTFFSFIEGKEVPFYHKEYFGYWNRFRGHYNEVHEGENIFLINTEQRFSILGPTYFHFDKAPIEQFKDVRTAIYGTVFADFGSAWDRNQNWGKNKISGYGVGLNFLAFYSLVLRTEIAFNGERKTAPEFILGIGASF